MRIYDFYLFRNLLTASLFVTLTLSFVILLTQSLKFLELVINSGASGGTFFLMSLLALPRFFEIIVPLALMASGLFIYNKLSSDSELVAMRATGCSPMQLARPALALAGVATILLWGVTMFWAPMSVLTMHSMSQDLKSQFSMSLFREGVFNSYAKGGVTIYIHDRAANGELHGLLISDHRDKNVPETIILAKRGVMTAGTGDAHQILVFDGSRQSFDPKTGALQKLNFQRYSIDLPNDQPVEERWAEPDERTVLELLKPDPHNERDLENKRQFRIEIHRRFIEPLLSFSFMLVSLVALLTGQTDRRGNIKRLFVAVMVNVVLQGLFLGAFSLARQNDIGILLMYVIVLGPVLGGILLLMRAGQAMRGARNLPALFSILIGAAGNMSGAQNP